MHDCLVESESRYTAEDWVTVPFVPDSSVEPGRLTDLKQNIPGYMAESAAGGGCLSGMIDSTTDPCLADSSPRMVHGKAELHLLAELSTASGCLVDKMPGSGAGLSAGIGCSVLRAGLMETGWSVWAA